jgi:predicted HicB family RNase H-like nuclease
MKNIMTIDGHKAVIEYAPDIKMFRGEFVGLHGGADFYATDVTGLEREGAASLKVFLKACKAKGIAPYRHFSGKFQARIPPELHERAVAAAAARGVSLNQLLQEALEHEVSDAA